MAEPRTIERRLELLGRELNTDPPDLTSAVRAQIAFEPEPPPRRWRRAAIAIVAAVGLMAGTAYAASADVREAVRDLLGIGAVEIERVPELDEAQATLELGDPIDPGDAGEVIGGELATSTKLGDPVGAFSADVSGQAAVTLVYPSGLLLTQINGRDPAIVKQVLIDSSVEPVVVNGADGFWIGGPDHLIEFPPGTPPRTSANSLIWTSDSLTLRLEAEVDKATALSIARSLR